MLENEISGKIVDCCFRIHKRLGSGLLKTVYKELLAYELSKENMHYYRQKKIPLRYENLQFNIGFRLDLLVESKVIVEIKSVEIVLAVHKMQLLIYLKMTKLKLGLLVNFNSVLMKDGIFRVVDKL